MTHGIARWFATAAAYLVPNFSALNVISAVAHQQIDRRPMVLQNYALCAVLLSDGLERRSSDL